MHTNGPHNTAHQWATQHCTPMGHTTMHTNGPHNTAQKGKDRATRISLQLGFCVSKNQIDIYLQFSIYSDILFWKWGSVDGHIAKNAIPFWNVVIIVKNIHKTQMFFVEAFGNKVQVVKVS